MLDNYEPAVRGASEVVGELIANVRESRLLVTAREPLIIGGETAFTLPPLATEASAALFMQRVKSSQIALPADRHATVEVICRQLGGLPRAIQLAAAQLHNVDVDGLLERLPDREQLGREAMRGFVEWSYNVLTPEEQRLLRALSIFSGGASSAAISAVCGNAGALGLLVEKALVNLDNDDGRVRYVVPATIRAFAADKARELGEWRPLGMDHAQYFRARAEALEASYSTKEWRNEFPSMAYEIDNIRAALIFTVTNENDLQLGARITCNLIHYWEQLSRIGAGREWIEQLLSREDLLLPKEVHAKPLFGLARLDGAHSQRALDSAQLSIQLWREIGDERGLASALYEASSACILLQRFDDALKYLDEGYEICKRVGDQRGLADVFNGRAIAQNWLGHPDRARELYEESLQLLRRLEDDRGVANLLGNLGDLAATVGEYDRAVNLTRQSLAIFERLHDTQSAGWSLTNLGIFELKRGELEAARPALRRALEIVRDYQDDWQSGNCVDSLARLAIAEKDWARALHLAGFADGVFQSIGVPRQPFDQIDYEQVIRDAQSALGQDAARKAIATGRGMAWQDALKEALQA